MKKTIFNLVILSLIFLASSGLEAAAQQESDTADRTIYIEPLFEYPVAPDSIEGIYAKSSYVVEHFWDKMDFKQTHAVDQNALNHAFEVFVSPMRWSDEKINQKVVANLLQKLQKNPTLSLQFTKAAELNLYSDRAVYWNDELYLQFIDNLLKTKKVTDARKERYKRHKKLLENSLLGKTPKEFDYIDINDKTSHYQPDGCITVIEFGDPECDDCRYAKLKMETDITFSRLVDRGIISVLFIIPDAEEGWQESLTDISPRWHVGASDSVADIFDIRTSPCFYVIDGNGKILAKNINYMRAMNLAAEEADKKQ